PVLLPGRGVYPATPLAGRHLPTPHSPDRVVPLPRRPRRAGGVRVLATRAGPAPGVMEPRADVGPHVPARVVAGASGGVPECVLPGHTAPVRRGLPGSVLRHPDYLQASRPWRRAAVMGRGQLQPAGTVLPAAA